MLSIHNTDAADKDSIVLATTPIMLVIADMPAVESTVELMDKAQASAKELGVNHETITGYKAARTTWSNLTDEISRNSY